VLNPLARIVDDINALRAAWNSVRGGWRAAWRDAMQLIAERRVVVETSAQLDAGAVVVLRTRIRLTADAETEVFRSWLEKSPASSIEELAKAHFVSVAAAVQGWSATLAMIRVGTMSITALGTFAAVVSMLGSVRQAGWIPTWKKH
jgi:hypothetical protein